MSDTDFDFERYKQLDFSNAKPANLNPKIKQLQERARALEQDSFLGFFDSDVREIIGRHNTPQDRMRVNEMIRLLFATA